jgi:hypothetical protein
MERQIRHRRRLDGNLTSEEEFQDLYKRGGAEKRKLDATYAATGDKVTIEWMQPSYYGSGEWPAGASVYKTTYSFEDEDDVGISG